MLDQSSVIRVGIVGASNAPNSWAKISHVPAVQKLKGLRLTAIATTNQKSADAAAQAFGVKSGYGNALDMFHDPQVDLVAIGVRVPGHRELVLGAIAAGKHVLCEWPLGRNLAEAEEMAAAASAAKVHVAIGLQTRMNPVAIHARGMLQSGQIGRLLSAHIDSTTAAFGPRVSEGDKYMEDAANGVTLVTVQGAHTVDFAIAQLGPLTDLQALITTQFLHTQIGDAPAPASRTTPDHLLMQSRLASGAPLSLEVAGGRSREYPFRLEAVGDKGVLTLQGGAARGFQTGRLHLSLNGQPQLVSEGEFQGLPDEAVNVAAVYAALRDDIFQGTSSSRDFDHAVRLTRLIDDVQSSSQMGSRKLSAGWPLQ